MEKNHVQYQSFKCFSKMQREVRINTYSDVIIRHRIIAKSFTKRGEFRVVDAHILECLSVSFRKNRQSNAVDPFSD
jgi:hypothetical protein